MQNRMILNQIWIKKIKFYIFLKNLKNKNFYTNVDVQKIFFNFFTNVEFDRF